MGFDYEPIVYEWQKNANTIDCNEIKNEILTLSNRYVAF